MTIGKKFLKKIRGDASFRSFYRKKNKKKTSIIVSAKKEKEKNLLIYDAINKLLVQNGVKAPKLLNHNYDENYIEIQDFGKLTIYSMLRNKKKNKLKIFKKIILLLNKIQKIDNKKIKNFKNANYTIPIYSKKLISAEAKLFLKWYVPKMLIKKKASALNKKLTSEINLLLLKLKLKNNTFVHRDFHVSNLMKLKKQIGILDSQDALFGNKAYDLASLIDDVRLKTSLSLKNLIYNYYVYLNRNKINENYFRNDFEILSVLRNLKVIGIFTRLAFRDKKKKYLKLIRHAWNLIENRINNNVIFADLKNYLDDNFSTKIRMKK